MDEIHALKFLEEHFEKIPSTRISVTEDSKQTHIGVFTEKGVLSRSNHIDAVEIADDKVKFLFKNDVTVTIFEGGEKYGFY